jgi:FtsZ-interacting cell division protein ZipA
MTSSEIVSLLSSVVLYVVGSIAFLVLLFRGIRWADAWMNRKVSSESRPIRRDRSRAKQRRPSRSRLKNSLWSSRTTGNDSRQRKRRNPRSAVLAKGSSAISKERMVNASMPLGLQAESHQEMQEPMARVQKVSDAVTPIEQGDSEERRVLSIHLSYGELIENVVIVSNEDAEADRLPVCELHRCQGARLADLFDS